MRIAELHQPARFRLIESAPPEPGPGEIQVRVHAVGICGSDLHFFAEGAIGDTPANYPMVMGHEPTGTVLKCGPGVTGWSPGDRAFLEPAIFCYHCRFCCSGRHNLCENVIFLSSPVTPGFFRDIVVLPAVNLLPMPDGVGFEEGTLLEPLSIIFHSMRFAQPKMTETAAVFGGGPIGLLTILVLKLSGVRRIWCVEPVAARREMAKRIGADVVIDPRQVDPVATIWNETGHKGVEIAIDCATKEDTINQTIHVGAPAARVVITGVPSGQRVSLDFNELRRREQYFFTVKRANHTSEPGIPLLRERPDLLGPLVTHRDPIERVQQAFERLEKYEDGVIKPVVTLA